MQAALLLVLLTLSQQVSASRVLDEARININGESRRYFHLHERGNDAGAPVILLVNGSGCADFSLRLQGFFADYAGPLNVYFLEKPHVRPGAVGQPESCSPEFERADRFERRVADLLKFLDSEPRLKERKARSVALLGFSEGGAVAPEVAAKSGKVGRLASIGAGGMKQSEEFLLFAERGLQPFSHPFGKEGLNATFADIARHPAALDKHFFGHPYAYWSSRLFHDPLPAYAQLDIPMVVAMGEKDESVPVESGRLLQRFFASRPQADFRFVEFPGADHGLRAGNTSHLKPFIARLIAWFKGEADAPSTARPNGT